VEEHRTELDSLLAVYGKESEKEGKTIITWTVTDEILGNTQFNFIRNNWNDAIIALKRGEADIIITDSLTQIRYHFDPRNEQAELAYMKCSDLLQSPSNERTTQQQLSPLTLKGVRYIDFFVPGLIAFGLMSSLLWGISYTIIECRSQKLLRRMIATPMKKSNFLVAIIFVRVMMNLVEALIIFFFAWLLFDIHIQGSIGALAVLFVAGNIAFAGISVLVSCRTSKTEAGTGLINAVQMPMMILSGIFFSYHNFPEWSIGTIKLLPLTALADGIRSIFNEGAGWMEIITPSIALSAVGIICFSAGTKLFKWQ
jgi:ABC-type multidrug transport system permease subunit